MKKILVLILLLGLCFSAEAAEKLKVKTITSGDSISTDNTASKLISVTFTGSTFSELDIMDGSTLRYRLAHTIATIGPYNRDTAPIFNTDIDAFMRGSGTATFVYIEIE